MLKSTLLLMFAFFLSNVNYGQYFSTILPKNDFYTDNQTPYFYWNNVDGATNYNLQISTQIDFSTTEQSINTTAVDFNLITPLTYSDYYWRVVATTPSGTIQSPVYSLHVFSPNTLTSLSLWLRADQGVVLDVSNRVEEWYDLSLNSHVISQTTPSKRPFLETNSLNNTPSILFAGGQVLDGGNIMNFGSDDKTIFFIAKMNGVNQAFISKSLAASASNRYGFLNDGGQLVFLYQEAGLLNISSAWNSTQFNFHKLEHNTNIPQNRYFLNNTLFGATSFSPLNNFQSNFRFLLGAYNNSTDTDEVLHLNGEINEIIYLDEVTPTSLTKVENYLKNRYLPILDLGPDITNLSYCDEDYELNAGSSFTSYLWNTGETTPSIIVDSNGYYSVTVTDRFGFISTDSIYVRFTSVNPPLNTLFCPLSFKTWDTELGLNYDYLWSTGETTESITINTPGNYFVTVTDTNGCQRTSDTLYFDEDPFASTIDLGPDLNLCSGNTVELVAGVSDVDEYLWHTGETTPSITATTSGAYFVDLINFNGCEATDTVEITIVGSAPIVDAGLASEYCINEGISFQDLSSTTDGSTITYWEWDFGDGNIYLNESGFQNYAIASNYSVQLTVESSSGCSNSETYLITIHDKPEIDFNFSGQCELNPVNFLGQQNSPLVINEWLWDFDDPSSGVENSSLLENPVHSFTTFGDFDVLLIAQDINGCKDSVQKTLEIKPAPVVNFAFQEVCAGGIVSFSNSSTILSPEVISSYTWQFGDGSTSGQTNPSKPYFNHGNYNVVLTATSSIGCVGSLSQNLKIHAFPQPDFKSDLGCAGSPIFFEDNSFVPNGSVAVVSWSFNGGPTVDGLSASHIFESIGNQEIEQTVMSAFGCEATATETINLSDFLTADFSVSPGAILAGYSMSFQNESNGHDSSTWIVNGTDTITANSFDWTFLENQIGDEVEVVLIVTNSAGCSDTIIRTYPVLENTTDLAINQLFVQESNGFYIIGAELENRGSTPITGADLFLRSTNTSLIKETWAGLLEAGDNEIYVFSVQIPSTISAEVILENFICVEAKLTAPIGFNDEDLTNNERCYTKEGNESILFIPYPNPTSNQFNLRVILPEELEATIQVFDAAGRLVSTIAKNTLLPKGLTTLSVDATNWSDGLYSIVLVAGKDKKTGKVQVLHRD